jgi:proton-dependent oligopeptide transporter, POT family
MSDTAAASAETAAIAPDAKKAPHPLREVVQPFIDLVHAPRALWAINLSYLLEGLVYFGWLTLLAIYFNGALGINDQHADLMVGFLTGGITLSMFFFGGISDKWGVRRAILVAVAVMLVGRVIMVASAGFFPTGGGLWSPLFWACIVGLVGVILGYGLYQPAAYSAVRQFTDERSAPMAYAMLYALMNLGGFLPGLLSPPVRRAYGIPGVFWVYVGLTVVGFVTFAVLLTRKVQEQAIAAVKKGDAAKPSAGETPQTAGATADSAKPTLVARVWDWLRHHPLADVKFSFFIFCLIPVQTLFAHNWLTLPQYVDRALGSTGHNYMEFFVNLNPVLIFVLTPMVAAVTRTRNVYKMMILGTLVMALPTFLLAIAPSIWLLLIYLVISSLGEAMWQPRFLQYAAEIAPPGRTGAYMGVAQFPWFLTKIITSTYAGWFLMHYCPEPGKGTQNTTAMWLIYACIAMCSTVMLVLAKGWLGKDFKTKAA